MRETKDLNLDVEYLPDGMFVVVDRADGKIVGNVAALNGRSESRYGGVKKADHAAVGIAAASKKSGQEQTVVA